MSPPAPHLHLLERLRRPLLAAFQRDPDSFCYKVTNYLRAALWTAFLVSVVLPSLELWLPWLSYFVASAQWHDPAVYRFYVWQLVCLLVYFIATPFVRQRTRASWKKDRHLPRGGLWTHVVLDWLMITAVGSLSLNPGSQIHFGYVLVLSTAIVLPGARSVFVLSLLTIAGTVVQVFANVYWLACVVNSAAWTPGIVAPESWDFGFLVAVLVKQALPQVALWMAVSVPAVLIRWHQERYMEQRSILESIIDHLPYPVFYKTYDAEADTFTFSLTNRQLLDQIGCGKDYLRGKTDRQAGLAHADEYLKSDRTTLREGQFAGREPNYVNTSDADPFVETEKRLVCDSAKQALGIVGMCRPAQPEIEKAMLKTICDQLPEAVFLKNREGRFLYVNPAFCKDAPLSKAEILGVGTDFLLYQRECADDYVRKDAAIWEAWNQDQKTGKVWEFVEPHGFLHEQWRTLVRVQKCIVVDDEGAPALLGIFQDVQSQFRRDRHQYRWVWKQMPSLLGTLAQVANAKDFGLGDLEQALRSQCVAEQIFHEAQETAGARSHGNWYSLSAGPVSLNEFLGRQCALASVAFSGDVSGVEFKNDLAQDLVHAEFPIDRDVLCVALWQMLDNARRAVLVRDHAGTGGDWLRALRVRVCYREDSEKLQLTVEDRGVGVTDAAAIVNRGFIGFNDGAGGGAVILNHLRTIVSGAHWGFTKPPNGGEGARCHFYYPVARPEIRVDEPIAVQPIQSQSNTATISAPAKDDTERRLQPGAASPPPKHAPTVGNVEELTKQIGGKLPPGPKIRIAISYANHNDDREELHALHNLIEVHGQGLVTVWFDTQPANHQSEYWKEVVKREFSEANIVLILLSNEYVRLSRQAIRRLELPIILERTQARECSTFAIHIRPTMPVQSPDSSVTQRVSWETDPVPALWDLTMLPSDRLAIADPSRPHAGARDAARNEVVDRIIAHCRELAAQNGASPKPPDLPGAGK